MKSSSLEKKYTKGQVIEGLYAYFSGYNRYLNKSDQTSSIFPEHKKAPKSFTVKIKKLLDLDRAQNKGDYVFFDEEGVGQGGLEFFHDFQVVLIGFAVDSLYKGFKQSEVLWVTKRVKERMLEPFLMLQQDKQTLLKEYQTNYYGENLYSTAKFHRKHLGKFIYLLIYNFEIVNPETHQDLRRIRYEFFETSDQEELFERLDKSTSCVIFDFINLSLVAPQVVSQTPIPSRGRPARR